ATTQAPFLPYTPQPGEKGENRLSQPAAHLRHSDAPRRLLSPPHHTASRSTFRAATSAPH
ncbi:MAG TPA: hypothetical protein VEL31_31265, partial [Ktedonobacteraceae bacterium]|nr:hypothetical protein [Ktedonobacteraceae bacterium]